MPELERISKTYAPRGVEVIGLSDDTYSIAEVRPVLKKLHITYLNLVDPHACVQIDDAYDAEPLPSVYVIDRKGIIRWSAYGLIDTKVLTKVLDTVLDSQ
jgi:hypothetical protein